MCPIALLLAITLLVAACSSADEPGVPSGAQTAGAEATPADDEQPPASETTPRDTVQDQPTATAASASPTSAPEPLNVTACGGPLPGGVAPGVSLVRELRANGFERSYRIYLPTTYRPSASIPLVLNFHGLGASAELQESLSGLLELAEREAFALVSPEGMGETPAWNVLKLFPSGADDLAFVEDILQDLAGLVCFEPARVYAAGFSNGGFMASLLACDMPYRFAAIAAVGGVIFPGNVCRQEVPILAFHGTADDVIPFDGGRMLDGATYRGIRPNLADWAALGHCLADAYPERLADSVTLEGYGPCDRGGVIWLVVLDGFGHEWPTEDNAGISAAELIWDFFTRYPAGGR